MTSNFVNLKSIDDDRIILNTMYISQVTPSHGDNFANGADVVFVAFGDSNLLQVSIPASQIDSLLNAIANASSPFLDVKPIGGQRLILNMEYVTHITPTHGTNLSDGADLSVWGSVVQVPASGIPALAKTIRLEV